MAGLEPKDLPAVLARIRTQAAAQNIRIAQHAHQEMVEENVALDEVFEAISTGAILENYLDHLRGACCLLYDITEQGRPLHVVCTTTRQWLIIITEYEPKPPKWVTPTQRRG